MPRKPDPLPLLSRLLEGLGHLFDRRERRRHDSSLSAAVRRRSQPRSASGAWGHHGADRPGSGFDGGSFGNGSGHPRRRRRSRGSALVQALMAALIAVIGAMMLASRLFSSRFNSFSRSDTLAAREAAEYGLNALQAQLNSDQYSYLWVTRRNNWGTVSTAALDACNVEVLDSNGDPVAALPSLPQGITSARTIKTDSQATVSYQLTNYEPPSLPDDGSTTAAQVDICGSDNAAAAANFGNLNGGSAIITVQGSVNRSGRTTNFTMRRTVHVASPAENLKYSFVILGNSYNSNCTPASDFYKCTPDSEPPTPATLGLNSDIAKLNVLDGNVCYGTPAGCSPSAPIEPTIIGCVDLESCLVNNIDTVATKTRNSYCKTKYKINKKRRKGIICNTYQQAGDIPPVITLPPQQDWNTLAREFKCDPKANKCEDYEGNDDKICAFLITIQLAATRQRASPG